ncbi:MAG: dihydroorotate dehydrogenase electron transfer subunit [Clostridiales bacterium]|nr:dihydroorotate dehydrogenase electron transfer subunit [Clostridiales bacterium]
MDKASILQQARLMNNQRIAEGTYSMELSAPDIAASAQPGQFVMVSVAGGADPFLRRPFSIAGMDADSGAIRLVYQVVGRGTMQMAQWGSGYEVDLLGPLGNGFFWGETLRTATLVGGGLGTAALLPLAKELRAQGVAVTAFIGARHKGLLFGLDQLSAFGCTVNIATEDGSAGFTGFATHPLEAYVASIQGPQAMSAGKHMLFACGPAPFLEAITILCAEYSLSGQISMEERMGCGFGVCIGCSVQTRAGEGILQKKVCSDGPVFSAGEVVFHG